MEGSRGENTLIWEAGSESRDLVGDGPLEEDREARVSFPEIALPCGKPHSLLLREMCFSEDTMWSC